MPSDEQKKRFSETMRINIPRPAEVSGEKRKKIVTKKQTKTVKRASKEKAAKGPSRYDALLQSIYDAVLITDLDGNIIDANVRAEDALQREKATLCGLRMADLIAGFDKSVLQTIHDNADQPRFTLLEAYSIRQDGSMFSSEVAVHKLSAENEEQLCFLIRDITVRKQAEEAIRWANRRKLESLQNLAGGVAHDFNNKLTGVIGNAQMALRALPKDADVRDDLLRIINNADEMAELSQKMLAYSGRGHFLALPVNLADLVKDFETILNQKILPNIELEVAADVTVSQVSGDKGELEQLLLHLAKNASESIGPDGGKITVTVSQGFFDDKSLTADYPDEKVKGGYYVVLEMRDTGHGMSEDTLSRIFDPFFSTRFLGRGLGLPAVLGIVQGHNGMICARSKVNEGTIFTVYFPVLEEKVEVPKPHRTYARPKHGEGTILIAEDDRAVWELAQLMLEQTGYTTLVTTNGPDCITAFRAHANEVDLVLLDMTMPGMNGAEVLVELRKIRPNVRVLLSSGYNEKQITKQFTSQRPDGFIHKPYEMDELLDKIGGLIAD